jgi:hypothetical protein
MGRMQSMKALTYIGSLFFYLTSLGSTMDSVQKAHPSEDGEALPKMGQFRHFTGIIHVQDYLGRITICSSLN